MLRPPLLVALALIVTGCVSGPHDASDEEARRGAPDGDSSGSGARTPPPAPQGSNGPPTSGDDARTGSTPLERGGCRGSGPVMFTSSPMRLEDFSHLLPYGLLAGAHVTPIDHMYFAPADPRSHRDAYEVRAVADGVIYNLQPRDVNVDTGASRAREWRMDVAHSCTFASYFDLVTVLDPALEAAWNESVAARRPVSIPIQAGQLVGRIGGQTLDFGVYDYNVTLPGFLVPEHYDHEPWKVHTVDPFPHFEEPVRSELLAKNLRQAEPRAGKIDYDVDGRLVGNWFREGTNGYAGVDPSRYWTGHLALAYDYLDPTQVRFSIGDFAGAARQFGVKGNAPDPADVDEAHGLVRYELQYYQHFDRDDPRVRGFGEDGLRPGADVAAENFGPVQGVALLQLVDPRTLKVEVFPGKTASEVAGFTDAAGLYER